MQFHCLILFPTRGSIKQVILILIISDEDEDNRKIPVPYQNKDIQTELIGAFGIWQGLILTLTGLTAVIHAWQMMANKFLTYPVNYWCERPTHLINTISVEQWIHVSSPLLEDGTFDKCHTFDMDYDQTLLERPSENLSTIACSSWEFDEETFQVCANTVSYTITSSRG